jgi:hypothetical protein
MADATAAPAAWKTLVVLLAAVAAALLVRHVVLPALGCPT